MVESIKEKLYQAIKSEGLYITDSRSYDNEFPCLLMRLQNIQKTRFHKLDYAVVDFTIDIFSKYNGEKEILDIESKLFEIVNKISEEEPYSMGVTLQNCKILEDTSTGPVMKHGVLTYRFVLSIAEEESL